MKMKMLVTLLILGVVHKSVFSMTCSSPYTSYTVGYRSYFVYDSYSYSHSCGWNGWSRCSYYKKTSSTRRASYQRSLTAYRTVCCNGYTGSPPHCTPVCTHPCQRGGACTAPDTCTCAPGWTGSQCTFDVNECVNTFPCQQTCTNTVGSFTCSCRNGYQLNSNGRTCRDINECSSSPCEHICTNTVGSYRCSCNSGYQLNTNGRSCRDIDECTLSPCQHTCENTPGSFVCSCNDGYQLSSNGRTCEDFPECDQSPCDQICVETDGSFQCSCTTGYLLASDGRGCNDINECASSPCAQICNNTEGSYRCSCNPGYVLHSDGRSCTDDNECALSVCEQTCTNTVGSFECSCGDGYVLSSNERSCDDIDECAASPCAHSCTNTVGSYTCFCNVGYQLNDDRRSCDDIDECATFSPCEQICSNTLGSFECSCNAGYELDSNGRNCTDLNECASSPCDQMCTNHDGHYQCSCQEGYTLRNSRYCDDIDECSSSPCGQTCTNTPGSFVCSCHEGYSLGSDGRTCTDINECTTSPCDQNCINTVGSFECSCNDGYELAGNRRSYIDECRSSLCEHICTNTPGSFVCSCRDGYTLDSNMISCDDINECLSSPCGHTCINTPGSFMCSCNNGYLLDDEERQCIDIDECSSNPCQQTCTNTPGSYHCNCSSGYIVNGNTCIDIDECTSSPCGHTCTNTAGSFECSCNEGYILSSDGLSCNDINECDEIPCQQICVNTPGSYQCNCHSGYTLDGIFCNDVNECTSSPCGQLCINNEGSYECSCNEGYLLSNNSHACNDINECTSRPCQQICTNTPGSYQCNCNSGYMLAGNLCIDVDECISSPCHQTCTNTPGTFVCSCDPGYVLNSNAHSCDDINECTSSPCGQVCTNTAGSYQCLCNDGFELDDDGITCDDINECDSNSPCSQTCTNTVGSYRCSCSSGYTADGTMCNDINECEYSISPCEDVCTNTEGSYTCSCNDHHERVTEDGGCVDIDECRENPGICEHTCANIVGGYFCSCPTGYHLVNGHNCSETDECAASSSPCQQACTNTVGSFQCSCNNGYLLDSDGVSCNDINECDSLFPCQQTCTNTLGSYQCSCDSGYTVDGNMCIDINECTTSSCNQTCANTVGSFECSCNGGYVLDDDGMTCNDINECEDSPSTCQQMCTNTLGSFQCSCNSGYTVDGTRCNDINECNNTPSPCEDVCTNTIGSYLCSCSSSGEYVTEDGRCSDVDECATPGLCQHECHNLVGGYHCTCDTGYRLASGHNCTDIDECTSLVSPCEQVCTNNEGSYECSCDAGYSLDNDQRSCNDIDECESSFPCDHICTNTIGSYECSCESGYVLEENLCNDIDECLSSPCQHACSNTMGSFECSCYDGYELNDNGLSCYDIDECSTIAPCTHNCTNTLGSFQCSCNKGYTVDGTRCNDINECNSTPSPCEDVCTNIEGSYSCSCNDHHEGVTEDGRCVDIDECAVNPGLCQYNCTNIIGGYYCSCPIGYQLVNGHNCSEINECDASPSPCAQLCTNNPGSFECSCYIGYTLDNDGRTCNDINECSNSPCQQNCDNTLGSFQCSCKTGYTADGTRCNDINECYTGNSCEDICINTDGAYECSCSDNSEIVTEDGSCVDFNECTIPGLCQQSCTNLIGGYYCSCQSGFNLVDGHNCTDINECSSSPCGHTCTNTVGSFECSCHDGYVLDNDGLSCNELPIVMLQAPVVQYINSTLVISISWMAPVFDRNILQLSGYQVAVSFNDRILTNSPMIQPQITSIVMSDYFAGHPQYFMSYNISVQALYGEELDVANRSNLVTANTFVLQSCVATSPISNTIRVLCEFLGTSKRISINATCTSCEGVQSATTVTGSNPLNIVDVLPESYSIEVIAVDASNKRTGHNSIKLTIVVNAAPADPPTVTVTVQSSSSIILAWEPPVLNQLNGIITHYDGIITETQILYLEDGTTISRDMMSANFTYNATDNHTLILDMLHPSYNYTVTMAAVTNVGKSPYSEPVIVTMLIAAPTEPPQNVSLNIITSDSFVLSWEPLNLEQQNGRVINYHVIIQEIQITYLDNGAVTSMVGANLNRTYSVTGNRTQLVNMLHPDYNYTVSVAAATSGGIGTFSVPLTVTMPEDAPSATVSSIQLAGQSSSSILLSWSPPSPEQQNGQLVYYHVMNHVIIRETQVLYLHNGTTTFLVGDDVSMIFNVTGNRVQLIDMLHPNYNYTVRMAAVTSAGIGPFSDPVTATTLEDAPTAVPSNIQLSAELPYSIRLSWDPPSAEKQNGRLVCYHVSIQESQLLYVQNRTVAVPRNSRNMTFNISESRVQLINNLYPNHTYTVRIAAATSAGIGPFSAAITVTTPEDVCKQDYSEGLVWEKLEVNQLSRIYCASLHSSFHSEVFITRYCHSNRKWGNIDFTSCTMRPDAGLVIMAEVKGNTSIAAKAPSVVNNVAESMSANHMVTDQSHHVYRVSGEEIVVGFVTVNITNEEAAVKSITTNTTAEEVSQDTVKVIMENVLLMNPHISFIAAFQPNSICYCNESLMNNSVMFVCAGPNASAPCEIVDENYQCTEKYSGDGKMCTINPNTSSDPIKSCPGNNCNQIDSLPVVSYIGCGISIFFLLLTVTIFLVFRSSTMKDKRNFVHLNLCIALLIGSLIFVAGLETAKNSKAGCIVVTTLLHYFILAAFCWTICETIITYATIVSETYNGFFSNIYFLLVVGWGPAVLIAVLSAGIFHNDYGIYEDSERKVCWLSNDNGIIWTFIAPVIIIVMINFLLTTALIYKIYKLKTSEHKLNEQSDDKEQTKPRSILWGVLTVLALILATWIVGLVFMVNSKSDSYAWPVVFVIISSIQGLAIFYFHVFKNKEVMGDIHSCCRQKETVQATLFKEQEDTGNFILQDPESKTNAPVETSFKSSETDEFPADGGFINPIYDPDFNY